MAEERLRPDSLDDAELSFHWHRYQAVAANLVGATVLEVGAGDGYGSQLLAQAARRVVAVDVDPATVREAASRYVAPNLEFRLASAVRLPFGDGQFDAVVALEVLEHLTFAEQEQMLGECRRVLAAGTGILVLSTPDRERTAQFDQQNPYHPGERTADELRELLGRWFPVVRLYYQELNAASVIWDPADQAAGAAMRGFGLRLAAGGSAPGPVAHDTHLTLVAVAGASADAVGRVALPGFLVEASRRLMTRLWARQGELEVAVSGLQAEVTELGRQVAAWEAREAAWYEEKDALWRQNRLLAEAVAELDGLRRQAAQWHEQETAWAAREAEWRREQTRLEEERRELRAKAERLAVIEASRGWQLVDRYWQAMERSALLRGVRRVLVRRPPMDDHDAQAASPRQRPEPRS